MDIELINAILGAGGFGGLILVGGWYILRRAVDAFSQSMNTLNQLQQDRTVNLERKLDACEKRHEEANCQIGHLREDCGMLKGRVQALEMMAKIGYQRQDRSPS